MMRTSAFLRAAAAAASILALASCAGEADVSADAEGVLAESARGAIDPASAEYFRVEIGDTIFFRTDSIELTPSARAVLDQQAAWLRANPGVSIRLEGHADERGTREYNIALGARRASAVSAYLASRGVEAERLSVASYGRERPLVSCPSEECWAQNRRVQSVPQ